MKQQYDLVLRPVHYACVSGGKDSLYMLNLILNNLDKYPLDCVVHYEMEIDWEWVKDVIDLMESRCKQYNIPFYRIKPRQTWEELYKKYGFPSRLVRWCNSKYKLDAAKQVVEWIESLNCRPVAYIGFCKDESKRFKYEIGDWKKSIYCYPLAEEGIEESEVLNWARTAKIFNDWYKYFRRQGCMTCPMLSMKEFAYMYKYYRENYEQYFVYVSEWEKQCKTNYFKDSTIEEFRNRIETKWVNILEQEENQMSIFDFI